MTDDTWRFLVVSPNEALVYPTGDLIDHFAPPLRELADGMAQYLQAFMEEVAADGLGPLDVDYQYLAEDFVESCVAGIMQVDGGQA